MTPEEITKTIEQMLSIQRQIQESQIRNTDNIARIEMQVEANARQIETNGKQIEALVVEISKLTVDQKEKFNQFYGYHQSADSDRLDIMERLIKVEQDVIQIKQKLSD
jgi:hypothetical protein